MFSGLLIWPVLFTDLIPVFFQIDLLMADSCLVAKSCLFCDPIVYSPPSSSVHGISEASKLEWVAVSFSRGSSEPGIKPASPELASRFFTTELPGKPNSQFNHLLKENKYVPCPIFSQG